MCVWSEVRGQSVTSLRGNYVKSVNTNLMISCLSAPVGSELNELLHVRTVVASRSCRTHIVDVDPLGVTVELRSNSMKSFHRCNFSVEEEDECLKSTIFSVFVRGTVSPDRKLRGL